MPSMDSSSSDGGDGQNGFERSDDFLDQMLSSISSWPELPQVNPKFPWDASSGGGHDQMLAPSAVMARSGIGGETALLSLGATDSAAALREGVGLAELRVGAGGVGFGVGQRAAANQQRFSAPQNYGGPSPISTSATSSGPPTSGGGAPPRQKVRARRGQATDPHSIAERLRRERIAERMKALQELVPNANKTDKASMLDEIIDYVKFLQLQVKVLSMSRLGGAAAVAPLMANMSSERTNGAGGAKVSSLQASSTAASGGVSGMGMTEHQVAKLMEEDMGSAMQYLQGKGLCLMPISLASAISTVTHSKAPAAVHYHLGNGAADHHSLDHAQQQQQHSPPSSSDGKEASSMSKSDA